MPSTLITSQRAAKALDTMQAELKRTMKNMRLPGHPRPFFLSYLLRLEDGLNVWGRYGSVFVSEKVKERSVYVDVRVGSHKLDQSIDGNLDTQMERRESYDWLEAPDDLDPAALRYALWRTTQLKYSEALQDYYEKKKVLVDQHLRQDVPSFSREKPLEHLEKLRRKGFDQEAAEKFVQRTSKRFRKHRHVEDPYVQLDTVLHTRLFVNSEGSRVVTQDLFHEVSIRGWTLAADGVRLDSQKNFSVRDESELPGAAEVERAIDALADDLKEQAKAKPMQPYAGPALLSGVAAGIVFHEAMGHRLEGERLVSRNEGHTFAGKLGQEVLPRGVDLIDDPSLARMNGVPLYGHYRVDDEGVPSEPVMLVEDGVLKTFLTSRTCTPGSKRSNGHGRHERYQVPMARMGNLIVRAHQRFSWEELKEELLELVRERGMPYGILITGAKSGETSTSSDAYEFQAFKGNPTEVYKVDAKTGRETRVRDVSFIGTPLAALQNIVAFGGEDEVDNSYCHAESGAVPVGTVAPAVLLDDLELQRSNGSKYRAPSLSLPPL